MVPTLGATLGVKGQRPTVGTRDCNDLLYALAVVNVVTTTLHSNTPRDALARLETMILMAGADLPIKAMRQQIASAVDLIIQVNRLQGGPRKMTSITEVMNMEQDIIIMQEVFRFKQLGVDQNGRAYGQFEATGVRPTFINRLESKGIKLPSNMFAERILMRD